MIGSASNPEATGDGNPELTALFVVHLIFAPCRGSNRSLQPAQCKI